MPQHSIDPIVLRRLDALERVIDSEYGGSPSVFQERTGIKMAQVSQWFTGYRALRDKALRRLEDKTRKPAGFYDAAPAERPPDQGAVEEDRPSYSSGLSGHASIDQAVDLLAEVLFALDEDGRSMASQALSNLARNPQRADKTAETLAMLVQMYPREPDPAGPSAPVTEAKSASERAGGKAKLTVTRGGGKRVQLALPFRTVSNPWDERSAPAKEQQWYSKLKAAPKAKG